MTYVCIQVTAYDINEYTKRSQIASRTFHWEVAAAFYVSFTAYIGSSATPPRISMLQQRTNWRAYDSNEYTIYSQIGSRTFHWGNAAAAFYVRFTAYIGSATAPPKMSVLHQTISIDYVQNWLIVVLSRQCARHPKVGALRVTALPLDE